jgi:hypothetical protein
MADYRLNAKIISRSTGQSAVAAAAYRAGERILDERTGEIKDYTRKRGILLTIILTPGYAPDQIQSRARLWNDVEHREDKSTRRSTAQLARELQLSLPHELTHEQRVDLVCDFIKKEFVEHGVVADIAIHAPPRGGDNRNYHAHVLLTLREIGPEGFGKKCRLWEQQEGTGKRKSWRQFETERLVEWRRLWAVYENRALTRYGHEARVDHRRLKDQGIDREPTIHIGPDANEMERRGINTDRGEQNRRIKAENDNFALAKEELAESEKRLAELKQQLAAERMEQIEKTVRAVKGIPQKPQQSDTPAPELPLEPEPPARRPRRPRPSAAERIEQIQKTVRAADAFWKRGDQPDTPAPEPPSEPEPPKPEPPEPPKPPTPSGPAPRRRPPSKYADLDQEDDAERAKNQEAERERTKEREKEHERKRKRGR